MHPFIHISSLGKCSLQRVIDCLGVSAFSYTYLSYEIYQKWALSEHLRYSATALHCEDLVVLSLQDQLLHMLQQITDGMDVEVHQLITLDLSLSSCTVGQFPNSVPIFMTMMNSLALLWLVQPL